MVRYAEPGTVEWIESGGGPLIAVPETVLPFWAGADGDETARGTERRPADPLTAPVDSDDCGC